MAKVKIGIIISTTRAARFADKPAKWIMDIASQRDDLTVEMLDLRNRPIGELSGYTAGFGGQIAINRWKRYAQIERWMKKHGGLTIFFVSAIPNFFVKLATVAAGALRYPLWRFFIFCWGGKTVKSLCFAFAGAGLFDGIKALIERIF